MRISASPLWVSRSLLVASRDRARHLPAGAAARAVITPAPAALSDALSTVSLVCLSAPHCLGLGHTGRGPNAAGPSPTLLIRWFSSSSCLYCGQAGQFVAISGPVSSCPLPTRVVLQGTLLWARELLPLSLLVDLGGTTPSLTSHWRDRLPPHHRAPGVESSAGP